MKAVRLKSSGQSVGRRMIYGGKDLKVNGKANVNAVCSVGLISKLLSFCVCVHYTVLRISKVIFI